MVRDLGEQPSELPLLAAVARAMPIGMILARECAIRTAQFGQGEICRERRAEAIECLERESLL